MMVNHDLFKSVELTTGGACEVRKAFYTFLVFHSSITCLRVMKKKSQLITHNIQMLMVRFEMCIPQSLRTSPGSQFCCFVDPVCV